MVPLKLPVPLPAVVLLSAMVGSCEVLQQIPLAVTADPPSKVMVPPPEAEVPVSAVMGRVVRDGTAMEVEKESSFP